MEACGTEIEMRNFILIAKVCFLLYTLKIENTISGYNDFVKMQVTGRRRRDRALKAYMYIPDQGNCIWLCSSICP